MPVDVLYSGRAQRFTETVSAQQLGSEEKAHRWRVLGVQRDAGGQHPPQPAPHTDSVFGVNPSTENATRESGAFPLVSLWDLVSVPH